MVYTYIYNGLYFHLKEVQTSFNIWVNLEATMLSEISQSQEIKYYLASLDELPKVSSRTEQYVDASNWRQEE